MEEFADILRLVDAWRDRVWFLTLAGARIAPVFQTVPFLGPGNLPQIVRGTLVIAMALFLAPWIEAEAFAAAVAAGGDGARLLPAGPAEAVPIIVKELALGLIFGFAATLAFEAAAGVGFLADNQRGLSMAQAADPLTGEQMSPMGSVMEQTLIMAFIGAGGMTLFFGALFSSYAFWPPLSFWPNWGAGNLQHLLTTQFAWYMGTLLTFAAPILLACFLVDLGMGLMNRFAPQLNVFFLAMPIKSAVSMALLILFWAGMFRLLGDNVLRLPAMWYAWDQAFSATGGGNAN